MPLGLPDSVRACLFDMDGVLTRTATVHAAAWKEMFDEFLARSEGSGFRPFDPVDDYDTYVDGRSRLDGTRAFLLSRGVRLPEGEADDEAGAATVHGLARRKNDLLLQKLARGRVAVFDDAVAFVRAAKDQGMMRAVVSASANATQVLDSAGISDLFGARVDGVVAERRHLRGKPAPDMFLAGAEELGVQASQAAVFEDAVAGVRAGRAGGFGCVIGVDRVGQGAALRDNGADIVVADLTELLKAP